MPISGQKIIIPGEIRFADLQMSRDPVTGDVEFSWEPIEKICAANQIDPEEFSNSPEDRVGELLIAWYEVARANGEPADPVQEQMIAEAQAADAFGEHRVQHGSGSIQ